MTRNPLGPHLPMQGDSEYTENMKRHQTVGKGGDPKLSQVKERVKPFEGNYSSVYQDYGQTGGQENVNQRACCVVTPQEREAMVVDSVQRIMQDPKMARQVFN